jgi:hypothetical protein
MPWRRFKIQRIMGGLLGPIVGEPLGSIFILKGAPSGAIKIGPIGPPTGIDIAKNCKIARVAHE